MRFPLFAAATAAVLLGFGNDARAATDPTAELQRYVAETEAAKSSLLKEEYTFELDGEPEPVSVITWKNLDYPQKMSVYFPGEHGATVHEYYYKDPQTAPVLVYLLESITTESVDGADKSTRANQFYFRDGQLIRWTGADRDSFPRTPEDVQAKGREILDLSSRLVAKFAEANHLDDKPTPLGPSSETTGVFGGIEEGDYTYLSLSVAGEGGAADEVSFMVREVDDSVERLLDAPEQYLGKTITVVAQPFEEYLESAGGRVEIVKVLSVKLPQ